MVRPSGEYATERTSRAWPARVRTGAPVCASQHRTVSSRAPEAISCPSAENATDSTPSECPVSVRRRAPDWKSHKRTVQSLDPEASLFPSGANATDRSASVCPGICHRHVGGPWVRASCVKPTQIQVSRARMLRQRNPSSSVIQRSISWVTIRFCYPIEKPGNLTLGLSPGLDRPGKSPLAHMPNPILPFHFLPCFDSQVFSSAGVRIPLIWVSAFFRIRAISPPSSRESMRPPFDIARSIIACC